MPRRKNSEAEVQPEAGTEAVTEQVQQIAISELHPFEGHPFKVLDDETMAETVESIKQVGIANPLIGRIWRGWTPSRSLSGNWTMMPPSL